MKFQEILTVVGRRRSAISDDHGHDHGRSRDGDGGGDLGQQQHTM